MFNSIRETVAFVTGGSSGLGLGTIKKLLEQGAKGCVAFDMKPTELKHDNLISYVGDVTNPDDVKAALAKCKQTFGKLNVVVNCAGIGYAAKIYDAKRDISHPTEEFKKVLHVNTFGTFNVSRLAAPLIVENPKGVNGTTGVIIMTSSVASQDAQIGQVAYAASKGAINGMTLAIARDLAGLGVRCVTIAPGLFNTALLAGLPDKVKVHLTKTVPCPPRLGEPIEYGHLVQAIIENSMLNGEVIRLDGALRMQP